MIIKTQNVSAADKCRAFLIIADAEGTCGRLLSTAERTSCVIMATGWDRARARAACESLRGDE